MPHKNHLFMLFITLLLIGLMSLIVTISTRYYETHYNAILHLIIIHVSYIVVGMIIGLEHLIKQYLSSGTWQLEKMRLLLFTLPLFLIYLALSLNVFGLYTDYRMVLNDLFMQAAGVLIGYSLAISISKQQ